MLIKKSLRKIITGLIFMMISFTIPVNAQNLGDVNFDNTINIVDALLIAQKYVGLNPSPFYPQAADVNCNNSIDIVDAMLIAQYYVQQIPQLPCETTPTPITTPTETPTPTKDNLGAVELAKLLGLGWNLGNTLEAMGPGNETVWGNPRANQAIMNAVKAAGFDSVRLPVAWSVFSNASNFTIDQNWLKRIEEVVNYALNAGLYVVLNEHWDGGWLNHPFYSNQSSLNNRLSTMWKQIANHFKDYDERLLFAGTNEVMNENDWGTPSQEMVDVQNSFNQTFIDAVRASGGNNSTRFLVVQSFNTNIGHAINFFKIPNDTQANRLFIEVHYYDPYNFTLNTTSNITTWPNSSENWANEAHVNEQMQIMKNTFINRGIGVIMGEYGVGSRFNVSGFETSRIKWNNYVTQAAVNNGIVPMYWDSGCPEIDGSSGLFNRTSGAQVFPDVINAIVNVTR